MKALAQIMKDSGGNKDSSQGGSTFNILWKAGNHVAKSMATNTLISSYGSSQRKQKSNGKHKEKSPHKARYTPKSPRKLLVGSKSPSRRFIKPMSRRQEWEKDEESSEETEDDTNDQKQSVLSKDVAERQKFSNESDDELDEMFQKGYAKKQELIELSDTEQSTMDLDRKSIITMGQSKEESIIIDDNSAEQKKSTVVSNVMTSQNVITQNSSQLGNQEESNLVEDFDNLLHRKPASNKVINQSQSVQKDTPMSTDPIGRITFNSLEDLNSNEEDEVNTVASEGVTLTGTNADRQAILPSWIRFRLIINVPPIPKEILLKKQRGQEIPVEYQNNDLRLQKYVKAFFELVRSFDESATIIEWSAKNDSSGIEGIVLPDALPTTTSELIKFFSGFKGKDQGAVYLRVRIITKFDHKAFLMNCQSWLKSNKHSLMRCPVQTEESVDIGWLGYSSIYSDKEFIARTLSKAVGYEVGVRLGAIANKAESKMEWRKKT